MTIVGIRPSNFIGGRGDPVSGQNIYLTYSLEKGEGMGTDRVFFTDNKLMQIGYIPKVGDEVRLEYNRFGKPSGIYLED